MVKYRNRVLVVEHKGRIIHRFRRIAKLQAHNRIEGYLKFYGSASPSGRGFPGYGECVLNLLAYLPAVLRLALLKLNLINVGFLRVGWTRSAQFIQTIVNPMV